VYPCVALWPKPCGKLQFSLCGESLLPAETVRMGSIGKTSSSSKSTNPMCFGELNLKAF
jgi:hypothetical protein